MLRGQKGFTLIELMIVVAIIAIIAAIAIPNLLAARLSANETSAVSTLRNISSCQAQFQSGAKCDVDRDGTGEFGFFRELTGASPIRTAEDGTTTGGVTLSPAVLSGSFRAVQSNGTVDRSGYVFKMWLQGQSGNATGEAGLTGIMGGGGNLAVDLNETIWACYSAPKSYSNSGNRTFFVNQSGDISATESSAYQNGWPAAGAAFLPGGSTHAISGRPAIGTIGRDSLMWRQVN